ncbi:MAG: PD-(D/E)XK nuclease family protein, partial [Planctomycetales bacterium]|nr:PD-(D/E)XK nuclease family protein [Planctomycetales bacterium]
LSSKAAEADSIELLGWLELPLDDAPAKIITSFNEGFVPSSIDSDLFLPNSLREKLGIDDSRRLYARDIYAANVIAASSQKLRVIVARHRGDGEPALPSRLLFAADDATILRRSLQVFADQAEKAKTHVSSDLPTKHSFYIPKPPPLEQPIDKLSVTAFRSYLACPYRFYLQHVLRLDDSTDASAELDPRAFGTLTHAVLEDFGAGPECNSQNSETIKQFLDHALNERTKQQFGRRARPAVRVQIEQMRTRLHAFAERQVKWRDSGWRIHWTENGGAQLETEFKTRQNTVQLVGRIDRVDRHEDTGAYAILDYKTSESGSTPNQTHVKRGEWVDLQLPLYRSFVDALKLTEPVELGYVVLPNETAKVDFLLADWSEEELQSADEVAAHVVDSICAEVFWPPTRPAPPFCEVFAAICQDNVFDRGDGIDVRVARPAVENEVAAAEETSP